MLPPPRPSTNRKALTFHDKWEPAGQFSKSKSSNWSVSPAFPFSNSPRVYRVPVFTSASHATKQSVLKLSAAHVDSLSPLSISAISPYVMLRYAVWEVASRVKRKKPSRIPSVVIQLGAALASQWNLRN